MKKESIKWDFQDVLRYAWLLLVIAGISSAALLASVSVQNRVETKVRKNLQDYLVRGAMLSFELSEGVTRIERALEEQVAADTKYFGGNILPMGYQRDVLVQLAGVTKTLKFANLLHTENENATFDETMKRITSLHAMLDQELQVSQQPTPKAFSHLKFLDQAISQLYQLHVVSMEDELAELTRLENRHFWIFSLLIGMILAVSSVFAVRVILLIRARLVEHLKEEEELKERERTLLHTQKTQALGTLVGGVAHDFNNLLTVIMSYADVLKAQDQSDEENSSAAERILNAGKRASNLTRQLLAFSHYGQKDKASVNLNQALRSIQPMLRRLIREDIAFDLHLGEDVGGAHIDHGKLEQVVMNLVTNACHAMPDGGRLILATESVNLDTEKAKGLGIKPGRYELLRIQDNGCGMSDKVLARVFEPYFTTKERGEGTGLGLFSVHGIVTSCGGTILVDSREDRGTCFYNYFPHRDLPVNDPAETASPDDSRSGSETILLVEDDEQIRLLTERLLRSEGYSVLITSSGEEALEVWDKHGDSIGLILSDVVLPGLRGPEFVERIRAQQPDIIVIYMSGYADDDLLAKVRTSNDPFLAKPFVPKDLFEILRNNSGRRLRKNPPIQTTERI